MRHFAYLAALLAVTVTAIAARAERPDIAISCGPPVHLAEATLQPHIDVVFCIDCSGSMGPVIETAKQKVWEIVNEIAKAKPAPALRIGLLGYGNADRSYRSFDLSDDLDEVYKNLVTFKDEGWGDEYVGLAVHKAIGEMHWSPGDRTLKVIFVVGNETARQGPTEFDYTRTAADSADKGIIVNAIYCGDTDYVTATPTWREMAKIGTGRYMEIAATGGAIAIATPFDKELGDLSAQLNTTYVAYGRRAAVFAANQVAQDSNATAVGGTVVAAQRAAAKSSAVYNNAHWDLVDASKCPDFKWEAINKEDLPADLQTLSVDQRREYVDKKSAERAEIQQKIRDLSAKREAVVQAEIKKRGLDTQKAFAENVRQAITEQARAKGFRFDG